MDRSMKLLDCRRAERTWLGFSTFKSSMGDVLPITNIRNRDAASLGEGVAGWQNGARRVRISLGRLNAFLLLVMHEQRERHRCNRRVWFDGVAGDDTHQGGAPAGEAGGGTALSEV
jgi:hypothetical protein